MIKRLSTILCVAMLAVSLIGCGKDSENNSETALAATPEPEEEKTVEETPEITLDAARTWYVNMWNDIVDIYNYMFSASSASYDLELGYDNLVKQFEEKDAYTQYIHDNHPDIADTWDKLMEQVDVTINNIYEVEVGDEPFDLGLIQQYAEAFDDYYFENIK